MISIEEANAVLGMRLGNRTAPTVNTWYVGLSTTPISEDGSGISEPSGDNGYHRVAIQNNSSNPIVFDEVTADCGTATHIFLSSEETGGRAAYYGQFTVPRPMPAQSNLTINAGDATFKIVNVQ